MRPYLLFGVLIVGLAACGGGGAQAPNQSIPVTGPSIQPQPSPTSSSGPTQGLVHTSFSIVVPRKGTSSVRPSYVSASTASVQITLNTVNGSAPPAGLTLSATTNISAGSCASGCTINGPDVPPGSDNFSVVTFDGSNAAGNVLSTSTQTFTVTQGIANALTTTLLGVPKTLVISGLPVATANTAFVSAQSFSVAAKDAGGNTITGTYANPITVSDSDASGAQGSSLSVTTLNAATDAIKINYGGLAIVPATITASATGATNGTATFTPALNPITSSSTEIDLYAPTGTGSTGAFTASESGWTNAPYNKTLTAATAAGCSSIATVAGASNSFTATAVGSPSAGSCIATISDGVGQTKSVTLTYTTYSFTVNGKPGKP